MKLKLQVNSTMLEAHTVQSTVNDKHSQGIQRGQHNTHNCFKAGTLFLKEKKKPSTIPVQTGIPVRKCYNLYCLELPNSCWNLSGSIQESISPLLDTALAHARAHTHTHTHTHTLELIQLAFTKVYKKQMSTEPCCNKHS